MKKWIIVIVLLGVAGVWAFKQWPEWQANAGGPLDSRPKTALVEQRDIRFSVPAAGEITPAEQVSVKPEINGRIIELPVDIGDQVKRGQLLFKLDDQELQNQRASAVTDVERARLQLEQAERNFERAQELYEGNLIAEELFETTKTEFALARNSLERSQRELAIIEERLTKTRVVAPFDSTILTRPVSIGQAVSGSGGFNSGTEVLTIADLKNLIINAHINQADITRLSRGQVVTVRIEAVPGLVVPGVVERIAPQATIRNNIKGFSVRILVKDADPRVRPGMTANINIPVASADNVVAVPLAAVFTERNPETYRTERYVYVLDGEKYERRPVRIGVADFFYAEVQSGLKPGEVVALEPPPEAMQRATELAAARENRENRNGPGGGPAVRPLPAQTNQVEGTNEASQPSGGNDNNGSGEAAPASNSKAANSSES